MPVFNKVLVKKIKKKQPLNGVEGRTCKKHDQKVMHTKWIP